MTVIIFLIVLAVLIFVHELGHFVAAKAFGVRVDAFKIGFGPKLIAWRGKSRHVITTGETEYGINLVPFGGYVKIFGENPDVESITGPDSKRSFVNKKRWQQAIVLAAGVLFNFIFAWAICLWIFVVGGTVPIDAFSSYSDYFSNRQVIVLDAATSSPAILAGLGIGDILTSVDSGGTSTPIKIPEDVQRAVNASGGKPIVVNFIKDGRTNSVTVIPVKGITKDNYAIGIFMDPIAHVQMPALTAIKESFTYAASMIKDTAVGLYSFVIGLFSKPSDFSDVAGPVGIAIIVGNATRLTLGYLLIVVAIISINLGVINLIPFPALDGGRILFVLIEGVIRRRISPKFTNAINAVGFILLMILMLVVTYKDIAKLIIK